MISFDQAQEAFRAAPNALTCARYLRAATEYFNDTIIHVDTFTAATREIDAYLETQASGAPAPDKPRMRQVCTTCGSVNVTSDALARWSEPDQTWEISCLLDNDDCDDCGGEAHIKEVPISADDPICECQNCDWRGLRSHINSWIPHYHERVAPGEPAPVGECPICKSLCHEDEP